MTHTEQIKVVAEYDGWTQRGSIFVNPKSAFGLTIERFRYPKSLDALSPVYKKVMGELKGLFKEYYNDEKWEIVGESQKHQDEILIQLTMMEPAPLFAALHNAIVFLTENKEK